MPHLNSKDVFLDLGLALGNLLPKVDPLVKIRREQENLEESIRVLESYASALKLRFVPARVSRRPLRWLARRIEQHRAMLIKLEGVELRIVASQTEEAFWADSASSK